MRLRTALQRYKQLDSSAALENSAVQEVTYIDCRCAEVMEVNPADGGDCGLKTYSGFHSVPIQSRFADISTNVSSLAKV